ncbi:hypothetical protein MKW92_048706 [Papaver armeniacum]|nr:hypothetical protein MKW92_048706 [Papaver armeniacum]
MTTSGIADDVGVSVQFSSPGDDKNDKTNLPSSSSREFLREMLHLLREEKEVNLTSNCSLPKSEFHIGLDGKHCQNKEAARKAYKNYFGGYQCHHPQCWMSKTKDRFLEVLLMVSSFLLSFCTAGAFYFTEALTIDGSHDPVLKHSLAAFNRVFAASFICNFLGVLICLILQYRREYHQYKKFILIISNTASFLFMVLGYGFVITFNIQRG